MSQIRKQSIISSILVYIGFALGFVNTYLFAREGGFTKEEYGLTGIFIAIASLMFSIANLGMAAYIYKFFPYYKDNVEKKKNDMLTWALLVSLIGFCFVTIGGVYFKDIVIRKFGGNSPQLVKYYYWVFPFGLGLTLYSILETYTLQLRKAVLANFLREIQFRGFTTILIILTTVGILTDFDIFIKIYSFTYIAIALVLAVTLIMQRELHFTFTPSIATIKFKKKIIALALYVMGGNVVYTLASVFDSLLLASVLKDGLAAVAVYTLAQNIASIVQAPQRGVISSSIAALSQAWKDKDLPKINRIYQRSSINQLIFAICVFSLIWLNFTDGVITFKFQQGYLDAKWVFFFIGLMRIVDMGTGVNAQIIQTSVYWKFEFVTGLILLSLTLPLNYFLTKYYFGIIGPALSNFIAFGIYNAIRYGFLKRKFNLEPFNLATIKIIGVGIIIFFVTDYLFSSHIGLGWMVARSSFYLLLYVSIVLTMKISPDIIPVWHTFLKKAGIKKAD